MRSSYNILYRVLNKKRLLTGLEGHSSLKSANMEHSHGTLDHKILVNDAIMSEGMKSDAVEFANAAIQKHSNSMDIGRKYGSIWFSVIDEGDCK